MSLTLLPIDGVEQSLMMSGGIRGIFSNRFPIPIMRDNLSIRSS